MVYHLLIFDEPVVSAAFVAAASRALNSPSVTHREGVEIWTRPGELYLSTAALGMVSAAFAPPPTAGSASDTIPDGARLVLDRATPAMGLTDALQLIVQP